jgi:hypothetical protein
MKKRGNDERHHGTPRRLRSVEGEIGDTGGEEKKGISLLRGEGGGGVYQEERNGIGRGWLLRLSVDLGCEGRKEVAGRGGKRVERRRGGKRKKWKPQPAWKKSNVFQELSHRFLTGNGFQRLSKDRTFVALTRVIPFYRKRTRWYSQYCVHV